ncbi:4024_t:CDS:2, partial [Paraglomus occultum]
KYLPTDPPAKRTKAIKPIFAIHAENEDPFWKDCIEKYFARPRHSIFENLIYPEYFKKFNLVTKYPGLSSRNTNGEACRQVYQDEFNNFVVERRKPIVVQFHFLKVQDGEQFFYQQLLLTLPCRIEEDLKG